MVYTKLGNGTETTYIYDKQRERLQAMNLTADGQTVMENRYRYDAVDNILGITNAANPTSLTKLNKAKLGGRSSHTYEYDELNRLVHASGKAKHTSYDMVIWIQTPRPNTTPNTNPGPPVSWNDPSNPDDPQAGYGYIPNDTTKEETFFYHSDHLGSTSYITDDKANITQYDAYLPYGELLVDEHSSSEDLPYKFNGKQFDEETGLYYYGARYLNPMASIWYGVDPLAEKYKSIGAYVYCSANPIRLIDSDGKKILFVNGYWNSFIGGLIGSSSAGANYWGDGFTVAAKSFFKDYSPINSTNFIDGSSLWGGDMSGSDRYAAGYKFAKDNLNRLTSGMKKGESFKMVTHSEGSAYGAGVAQYLLDAGYKVTTILHLSSDEGDEFSTPKTPYTLQLSYEGDWVTRNKTIKNVDKVGEIKKGNLSWDTVHGTTKNKNIFNAAKDLKKVTLQLNIGEIDGKLSSWYNQENAKKTNFYSVNGIILNNLDGTKKR